MARNTFLRLSILLGCLGLLCAQDCLSVNDVLPQVPKDLQELIKKEMDVLSFQGTFLLPTETAWQNKDLDPKLYDAKMLRAILRLSIIPGVRLATRPGGAQTGVLQVESKFKDKKHLACITGKRPDNKLDLELLVTGSPSQSTDFSLSGTSGNKYKAGGGEIQIVKVYSDIGVQNMTKAMLALRDKKAEELKKNTGLNLTEIASWEPANVVKVVQCKNADIFYVDHLLLPCPLCGKKCISAIVDRVVEVMLPVLSVFAVALAVGGYFAICCGCKVCSGDNACNCFWKCACSSLVLIIIVFELLVAATFAYFAVFIDAFMQKDKAVKDYRAWQPYFIWALSGALIMGLVIITHVWSFISQGVKQRKNKQYQKLTQAQAPHYAPGGLPPIY